MGLSDFYISTAPAAGRDDRAGIDVIHHALDVGMTLIDTADMYGPFSNERLVGAALVGKRDQAIVATKFGFLRAEDGAFEGLSGRPDYVKAACEASLQRLGIETIDLYYQHRVDPEVPIEDTVGAMSELVTQGKVKYLGLSEAAPATVRRAHKVHPIAALQTEYSLWSREPEQELLATCEQLGIYFVAYSPLGRGFLAGRFTTTADLSEGDWRRELPRMQPENLAKNVQLLRGLETMAAQKNCTTAQLSLAWVKAQGSHVVPLTGTTRAQRVDENFGALRVELSTAELRELGTLFPLGAAAGTRYPETTNSLLDG